MSGPLLISKIQPFSLHDGPGIRTTVFMKGCSLSCPWCANPENIRTENELWVGTEKPVAKEYTPDELFDELMYGSAFWADGGGVTFSGGEALLQIEALEPVLAKLKECNVHIAFETALHVPEENVTRALQYADFLYADMKDLRSASETYVRNLETVDVSGIPYVIRIPLVKPFTYNDDNLALIERELRKRRPQGMEVFKAHTLAKKKYAMLGRPFVAYDNVSEEELAGFAERIGATVLHIV